MAKRQSGLGRGLDALLSGSSSEKDEVLRELSVAQLKPGKYQPRTNMDGGALQALADSIKAQGIMQPIIVRQLADYDYEIIAGERRWRAAKLAGLAHVPVLVRSVADEAALAMALIENIQREGLNPLEEAHGLQRLVDEFGLTHQRAADAVGRSRSAASNLLRLLNLAPQVQQLLMQGRLDMGHARALLSLPLAQQILLANKVVGSELSVRETEQLVQQLQQPPVEKTAAKVDRDTLRLQEQMSEHLGVNVQIKSRQGGRGKLVIEYDNHDQLDSFLGRLKA